MAMHRAADFDTGRQAIILPTTSDALRCASLLSDLGLLDVTVGRWKDIHALAPAQALARVEHSKDEQSISMVVFSDQLVSAVDAPVLVDTGSTQHFASSIEYVLNNLYGFHLRFFLAARRSLDIPAGSSANLVFSAHHKYLLACEAQGATWVARSEQIRRTPDFRRRQQRIRIQALRSSLLFMTSMGHHPWDKSYDGKLQTLDHLYSRGLP
jgi:hypothetical protein